MSPRSLRLPGHDTEMDIDGFSLLTGLGVPLLEEVGEQIRSGGVTKAISDLDSTSLCVDTQPSGEPVVVLVGAQFWDSPFGPEGDAALRALLNAASRTVADLSNEYNCLDGDHNIARRAHQAAADSVVSTRARIDPHAAAHLRRVRSAVDGATRRGNTDDHGDSADNIAENTSMPGAAEIPDLTRAAIAPVRDALAAIKTALGAASSTPVLSPQAQSLADELDELTTTLVLTERRLHTDDSSVVEHQLALDQARQQVAELEKAQKPETVSASDIVELESAHERVLEAEERASGRFRASRALKVLEVLEEATEQEQAILDRLGFATWSAFIMGTTLFGSDDASPEAIAELTVRVGSLQLEADELSEKLNDDDEYRVLEQRRQAVLQTATELVGSQLDVVVALRNLTIVPAASGPTVEETKEVLTEELAGLEVLASGASLDEDELMKLANDWLAETASMETSDTEGERHHGHEPEQEQEQEHAEPLTDGQPVEDRIDEDDPVRRRVLDDAIERLAQHRAALEQTAALLEEVEVLGEIEIVAQANLDQHRGRLDGARRGRSQLAAQLVGWRLHSGESGGDPFSALTETGESGLIIVEPLESCDVASEVFLEALGVFAEHTSLTLISDDPVVAAWAEEQNCRVVEVDRALATS